MNGFARFGLVAATFCAALTGVPASAGMVLSQVIVDLQPDRPPREDVEVWNDGDERMYVLAEPYEIKNPGTPTEQRVAADDPTVSGLLVSPRRIVLEPGERRTLRIAEVGERPASERVYRVAIKPVTGIVSATASALKVLIGYDALVLVRPSNYTGDLLGDRAGRLLTIHNNGNASQELFEGRQCDASGGNCQTLPAKRLYAGASWQQTLPYDTPVNYKHAIGSKILDVQF